MSQDLSRPEAIGLTLARAHPRIIFGTIVVAVVIGTVVAALRAPQFISSVGFTPQAQIRPALSLERAEAETVSRLATAGGAWRGTIYIEVIRSRSALETIARSSLMVPELQGAIVPMATLMGIETDAEPVRIEKTIQALRQSITALENTRLNMVRVTVRTPWATVSKALAELVMEEVKAFDVAARSSQASAELMVVASQIGQAERELRLSEDSLEQFMQNNRSIAGSAQLRLTQGRLFRTVTARRAPYVALLRSRDILRLREVQDAPVVAIVEAPRLAATPEPRRIFMQAVLSAFGGLGTGIAFAFLATIRRRAARTQTSER